MSSIAGPISNIGHREPPVRFFRNFSAKSAVLRAQVAGETKVHGRRRGPGKGAPNSGAGGGGGTGNTRPDINRRSSIRLDEHNLHARRQSVQTLFFRYQSRAPRKQLPTGHKSDLPPSLCADQCVYMCMCMCARYRSLHSRAAIAPRRAGGPFISSSSSSVFSSVSLVTVAPRSLISSFLTPEGRTSLVRHDGIRCHPGSFNWPRTATRTTSLNTARRTPAASDQPGRKTS